jgi:hypothetical protein
LEFIGGGKFGFMVGDAVRDKDAVAATLLICGCSSSKSKEAPFTKSYCNYVENGF